MELAELKAKAQTAQAAVCKAEETERNRENTKLVGRVFKYRNSYSGGEKWWLYTKVVAVKGGNLICFQFQTCSFDKVEIEFGRTYYYRLTEGHFEIKHGEFNKAWRAMQKRVASYR